MTTVSIAENLLHLRREKGITQDILACFLGVSKASVSKWENGISLPDIMQLPRIAAFYGISIDELMGYEAQLSEEEIKRQYELFAKEFAEKPFEEVIEEVREFVHQYYSCYPALMKMAVLLLNHYMLAVPKMQKSVLEEMIQICMRIQEKSSDVNLCNEAVLIQSAAELYAGRPEKTIEKLQNHKYRCGVEFGGEMFLVQAYQMAGQQGEALEWNQVVMYQHLLSLIQSSTTYLMANLMDRKGGERIIRRTEQTAEIYELNKLHPNTWLQFQYAKALFYAGHGEIQDSLNALNIYVEEAIDFVKNGLFLHGDAYFDRLDQYIKKMDSFQVIPRNQLLVLASVRESLDHPAFEQMRCLPEFRELTVLCQFSE